MAGNRSHPNSWQAREMAKMLVVGLLLLLLCLGGIVATAQETINIGVLLPMTGNMAALGRMEWQGIKLAHRMTGKILGREVKLFLEDSMGEQTEAADAAERMVTEHQVVAIIGGATSGTALAAGPIAEKYAIPFITPSATNSLVIRGKKYVFRACFDDYFQSQAAARQARIAMGAGTAAVIVDIAQADYSVGLGNLFLKAFGEMGGKVLVTSYIQTGDRDFSSQLSEILASNPEVIYMPDYYLEAALVTKQVRALGTKVPILMADGAQTVELIQTGGEALEGVYLTAHFNLEAITTELGRKFAAEFKNEYQRDLQAFSALGADAYFLLAGALERAKSAAGAQVRAAMTETKDFHGVSGTITIDEDGNTSKSLVINMIKNGKFSYVTTVNP